MYVPHPGEQQLARTVIMVIAGVLCNSIRPAELSGEDWSQESQDKHAIRTQGCLAYYSSRLGDAVANHHQSRKCHLALNRLHVYVESIA